VFYNRGKVQRMKNTKQVKAKAQHDKADSTTQGNLASQRLPGSYLERELGVSQTVVRTLLSIEPWYQRGSDIEARRF